MHGPPNVKFIFHKLCVISRRGVSYQTYKYHNHLTDIYIYINNLGLKSHIKSFNFPVFSVFEIGTTHSVVRTDITK